MNTKNSENFICMIMLTVVLLAITSCSDIKPAPQNNNVEISGSGNIVSEARELAGFDTVEAGLTYELTIRQGEPFGVVLIADDNWIDFLSAEVDNSTLILGLKDGYAYNIRDVTMRVEVTMPDLAGLHLDGSSRANIEGFQDVESMKVVLSGASYLSGALEVETVDLDLAGSSTTQLTGSSEYLRLAVCGNSLADLKDFAVQDAELELACNATAIVQVDGRLGGQAAQNAMVFYIGQPTLRDISAHQYAYIEQK